MRGSFIRLDNEVENKKMLQENTEHLRSLIGPGSTVYCKLIYKSKSNLSGAKRGYALTVAYIEIVPTDNPSINDLKPMIEDITQSVAMITGTRFNADEPQCLLVQHEDIDSVIKALSLLLYWQNDQIKWKVNI